GDRRTERRVSRVGPHRRLLLRPSAVAGGLRPVAAAGHVAPEPATRAGLIEEDPTAGVVGADPHAVGSAALDLLDERVSQAGERVVERIARGAVADRNPGGPLPRLPPPPA